MRDDGSADISVYEDIVDVYDIEHADFDADIDLYLNLAEAVGDPILELGCGSGRVLLPLAEAGFRVTGVDGSPSMLSRAAERVDARALTDQVSLVHADMRHADEAVGGPFGLIIISLNGLLHIPTQTEQRRLLSTVRRALDPRGQLVLDLFNPTPDTLRDLSRGVQHEGAWPHPAGGTIDKWSSRRLVASEQLLENTVWYDHLQPTGNLMRKRASFPMRYVYLSELALMLEEAGFAEWQAYGGYDLESFDDGAERLIVTAEVTPSRAAS